MKVTFLGGGNMASALIGGLLGKEACGDLRADDIAVVEINAAARDAVQQRFGVHCHAVPEGEALACDALVLAVKPQQMREVCALLKGRVRERLIISIAAGLHLADISDWLGGYRHLVRAMPNMAAAASESMTALAAGRSATREDLEDVRRLMSAVGRTVTMAEKNFSAFVGLAGSSPAFVLTFIEALARAGVMDGIPKAQAVEIVTQAVLGSARIVQVEETRRADGAAGRTPADLIDAVCSPGGTTVAGVVAMERSGFSSAVIDAFEATVARDRELGA